MEMSYSVEEIAELIRYHIVLGADGNAAPERQLGQLIDAVGQLRAGQGSRVPQTVRGGVRAMNPTSVRIARRSRLTASAAMTTESKGWDRHARVPGQSFGPA